MDCRAGKDWRSDDWRTPLDQRDWFSDAGRGV